MWLRHSLAVWWWQAYRRIEILDGLTAVLAIPDFELATRAAVEALPALIPVKDAVFNIGQACLLVTGFMTGDWDLVGQAMQDRVHQPYRQSLIPGLNEVLAAARQQGALGAALSGAGPTVLALNAAANHTERIGQAMQDAFMRHGVKSVILKLKPLNIGARLC